MDIFTLPKYIFAEILSKLPTDEIKKLCFFDKKLRQSIIDNQYIWKMVATKSFGKNYSHHEKGNYKTWGEWYYNLNFSYLICKNPYKQIGEKKYRCLPIITSSDGYKICKVPVSNEKATHQFYSMFPYVGKKSRDMWCSCEDGILKIYRTGRVYPIVLKVKNVKFAKILKYGYVVYIDDKHILRGFYLYERKKPEIIGRNVKKLVRCRRLLDYDKFLLWLTFDGELYETDTAPITFGEPAISKLWKCNIYDFHVFDKNNDISCITLTKDGSKFKMQIYDSMYVHLLIETFYLPIRMKDAISNHEGIFIRGNPI